MNDFFNWSSSDNKTVTAVGKRMGVKYCWLIMACCCGFASASVGLCTNADGVFYSSVSGAFGVGTGAVALYSTFAGLTMGISMPFMVKIMRKIEIHHLMRVGVVVAAVAIALMGVVKEIWLLYVLGILRGIGCATFTTVPVNIIVGNWFKKRRSVVYGLVVSIAAGVGAIFNVILSDIIEGVGYQMAYFVCAIALFILAFPGTFLVRATPEIIGLEPYGVEHTVDNKPIIRPSENIAQLKILSALFIMSLAVNGSFVAISAITNHLPNFAVSLGRTITFGGTLSSTALIGSVFAKTMMGVLCEKIGPVKAVYIVQSTNVVALLVMILSRGNDAVLLCSTFIFGLVYGTTNVAMGEFQRTLYGNEQYGSAFSIMALVGNCSSAISVSMFGFVYDATQSYYVILAAGIGLNLIAMTLMTLCGRLFKKETGISVLKIRRN